MPLSRASLRTPPSRRPSPRAVLGIDFSSMGSGAGPAGPGADGEDDAMGGLSASELRTQREAAEEARVAEAKRARAAAEAKAAEDAAAKAAAEAKAAEEADQSPEAVAARAAKKAAAAEKEKGTAHYKAREFGPALEAYRAASALDPSDMTHRWAGVRVLPCHFIAATTSPSPCSLNEAAVLFETGDFDSCIAAAQTAVEKGRAVMAPFQLVGKAFARIGNARACSLPAIENICPALLLPLPRVLQDTARATFVGQFPRTKTRSPSRTTWRSPTR